MERHNRKANIRAATLTPGDLVLVGIPDFRKEPKLSLRWDGPARVLDISDLDLTFQVQMLNEEIVRACVLQD